MSARGGRRGGRAGAEPRRALSRAAGGGGSRGGSRARGPLPQRASAPSPPLPPRPPSRPRRHVGGEAQGRRENGERSHQPESGGAGRLRGAVQNQAAHPAEQADEGVLRAAGLVNEAD